MNDGALLKYYRIKKDMSQEELAESIVSPSYLSRIENGRVQPDDHTMNLLFERLGLDMSENKEVQQQSERLLRKWEIPLLNNDKTESIKIHEELTKLIDSVHDPTLLVEYQIKKLRHSIITKQMKDAEECLELIEELENQVNERITFYYYKHLGNYYYLQKKHSSAESFFSKGLNAKGMLQASQPEKADFLYLYSLCLSRLGKDGTGLEYAHEALEIFKENYHLEMCVKTHIQIGVSYSRISNFEKSMMNYNSAKELSDQIGYTDLLGVIDHNIGNLLIKNGHLQQALPYLERSIEHKSVKDEESFFNTLLLILSTHYRLNDSDEVALWLKYAWNLVETNDVDDGVIMELNFFRMINHSPLKEWEAFINKEFFPYLKTEEKWHQVITYSKILASHYTGKNMYKYSTKYLQLALETYETLHNY
ncbi:XRE family transcriptional regulator [Halobacillus fulvus]|nr:XRE family transcriptional regulator [Halobacillus fulvus]